MCFEVVGFVQQIPLVNTLFFERKSEREREREKEREKRK